MHKVLVLGAGNIGSLIACLLSQTQEYEIHLVDKHLPQLPFETAGLSLKTLQLDVSARSVLTEYIQQQSITAVISCLPYFCNQAIAEIAREFQLHYFDLTEDVNVATYVGEIAQGATTAFMPRCGLAPGFINIVAHGLMQSFDSLESVELRVGNLPININNALHYALSWSTDGLINEYGNPCQAIVDGKAVVLPPLEDLETIEIDGKTYEAFNTSGGVGSLVETYLGKVRQLNYKTIRYPGHCEKMRFLMKDLQLNQHREMLKLMLEQALPRTAQDVALIYVAVTGYQKHQLITETYVNHIYPQSLQGHTWTAIQRATAFSLCAVFDHILQSKVPYRGLVLQEQIVLADFLANRFGKIYQNAQAWS